MGERVGGSRGEESSGCEGEEWEVVREVGGLVERRVSLGRRRSVVLCVLAVRWNYGVFRSS